MPTRSTRRRRCSSSTPWSARTRSTTAQALFQDGVGFSGVVLRTKLDGDARGGAGAVGRVEVTGQPIMFASNGEGLTEFDVFHPDRMASRILGTVAPRHRHRSRPRHPPTPRPAIARRTRPRRSTPTPPAPSDAMLEELKQEVTAWRTGDGVLCVTEGTSPLPPHLAEAVARAANPPRRPPAPEPSGNGHATTVKAYADRTKENGARVVGIVGVMKTGPCEPLLDPNLYEILPLNIQLPMSKTRRAKMLRHGDSDPTAMGSRACVGF